jgi:hypothetical protein
MYQVGLGDSAVPTSGTLYFSTAPYIDQAVPRAYVDAIDSVPTYQRSIDRTTLRGKYSANIGALVLDNSAIARPWFRAGAWAPALAIY